VTSGKSDGAGDKSLVRWEKAEKPRRDGAREDHEDFVGGKPGDPAGERREPSAAGSAQNGPNGVVQARPEIPNPDIPSAGVNPVAQQHHDPVVRQIHPKRRAGETQMAHGVWREPAAAGGGTSIRHVKSHGSKSGSDGRQEPAHMAGRPKILRAAPPIGPDKAGGQLKRGLRRAE
jgi:hypothetical protein